MNAIDIDSIAEAVSKKLNTAKTWLTPDDLQNEYGVSKIRQGALRSKKMIPFSKRGRYIRYKREDIDQWFESAKVC